MMRMAEQRGAPTAAAATTTTTAESATTVTTDTQHIPSISSDTHRNHQEEEQEEPEEDTAPMALPQLPPPPIFVPNDTEITLLCLDYLRHRLRREYHDHHHHHRTVSTGTSHLPLPTTASSSSSASHRADDAMHSNLSLQYLSVACWALQNSCCSNSNTNTKNTDNDSSNSGEGCFVEGTDAFHPNGGSGSSGTASIPSLTSPPGATTTTTIVWPPDIVSIQQEIILDPLLVGGGGGGGSNHHNNSNNSNNNNTEEKKDSDDAGWRLPHSTEDGNDDAMYDDDHPSNAYRMYRYSLTGLPSPTTTITTTVHGGGNAEVGTVPVPTTTTFPLSLPHILTVGLHALQAQSRIYTDASFLVPSLLQQPQSQPQYHHSSSTTAAAVLLDSYLAAVQNKGFFADCCSIDTDRDDAIVAVAVAIPAIAENSPDSTMATIITNVPLFEEKFRKVMTKFRNKFLVSQQQPQPAEDGTWYDGNYTTFAAHLLVWLQTRSTDGPGNALSHPHMTNTTATTTTLHGLPIPAAYVTTMQQRLLLNTQPPLPLPPQYTNTNHTVRNGNTTSSSTSNNNYYYSPTKGAGTVVPSLSNAPSRAGGLEPSDSILSNFSSSYHPGNNNNNNTHNNNNNHGSSTSSNTTPNTHHPTDLREAEKFKNLGNTYMQQKCYDQATECYTSALQCSPTGPNAHVYYSNRAAAAISLKHYSRAIQDSERSLLMKPEYGKAHARLGLAHFLSGHYRAAVEAYTVALKYEPENVSSRNYLEKSALRLAEVEQEQLPKTATTTGTNVHHHNTTTTMASSPPIMNSFSVISEMERSNHHHHHHHPTNNNNHNKSSNSSVNSSTRSSSRSRPSYPPPESSTTTTAVNHNRHDTTTGSKMNHPDTAAAASPTVVKEAERLKVKGNTYMANKDYPGAIHAYTNAIQIQPYNPQVSHVYYSNRAAAYCYLEYYELAEQDAMAAIQMSPQYGKAHARLGLARFFLKNYMGAISAYETALLYDPHNTASQSYLQKAYQKLQQQQPPSSSSSPAVTSVVHHRPSPSTPSTIATSTPPPKPVVGAL
jgi:tetratricopeptide (TPR) repeat protein